jgi:hypothetical protein
VKHPEYESETIMGWACNWIETRDVYIIVTAHFVE